MYKNDYEKISFDITEIAIKAMLYEVSSFPSPGLVSPVSNGSHKDMDFYSFIDSTVALNRYIYLFAKEGFKEGTPKEIFNNIRKIGIEAEKTMFKSTKGVNTHKGMIFLMGIIVAATANSIYKGDGFETLREKVKQMCFEITKDELGNLDKKKELSHGEKLFKKYKITGIRGEAENGMPLAFDVGLKAYKEARDLSKQERLVQTLITIMCYCDDSTILHRHNFEVLEEVKKISRNLVKIGAMKTAKGKREIEELNEIFINRNISPGGSADILAISVFLYYIESYFKTLKI
ncbi:MAG: triphosphoribosyl-dephospho-CoA synthase CitG [Sarcina sp.]